MSPRKVLGVGQTPAEIVYPAGTGDNSSDSTVAVQAAINAANAAGGGIVQLPAGTVIVSQVSMKSNVWLRGSGRNQTTLKLKDSSNQSLIILATAQTMDTLVSDMTLEGNRSNQSAGNWHGIFYDNTGEVTLRRNLVRNILATHFRGDGVHYEAGFSDEGPMLDIISYFNDRYGVYIGIADMFMTNVDCGQNGKQGIVIAVANTHCTNCKAWFSGRLDSANGDGFLVTAASRITLASCEAQDNVGNGFYFLNSNVINAASISGDSNGTGTTAAGIKLDGVNNSTIVGAVFDRNGSPVQAYGVQFANTNTNNTVILSSRTNLTSDTNGTIANTNMVAINGVHLFPDGVAATPGIGFANEPSTGFFRTTTGQLEVDISGTSQMRFTNPAFLFASGVKFAWTSGSVSGGTQDTFLRRVGAANPVFGNTNSASPTANTLTIGESSRGGTDSNVGGAAGAIGPGIGTGNGGTNKFSILRNLMGASGSTAQTQTTALSVGQSKTLSTTSATAQVIANVILGSNAGGGCSGTFTIVATDGTNFDSETQSFNVSFVNKATVVTVGSVVITATTAANNSGSCTLGITAVANGNNVDIKVTPVFTTIVPTTVTIYPIITHATGAVTFA